jgi:hypothetical protein
MKEKAGSLRGPVRGILRALLQSVLALAACLTGLLVVALAIVHVEMHQWSQMVQAAAALADKEAADPDRTVPDTGVLLEPEPAPDFRLLDVDGRTYHLAEHLGKGPVVIEFSSFT